MARAGSHSDHGCPVVQVRVCSGPGCLRAVPDDVRYCDECKPVAVVQAGGEQVREHTLTDRERYATLYSAKRWQTLRARVMREQPLCARCRRMLSEIADHVVPAGVAVAQARESGHYRMDRHAGFFLRTNVQGLCRPCHWVKTNEDKIHVGSWPDVIAIECAAPRRKWLI